MSGRHRSRRQRPANRGAKVIGGAVGLVLAWQVVQISLGLVHGSNSSDLSAADFASDSSAAATTAAEQRLADGDPAGAATLARKALAISPISSAALRILGLAELQQGHVQQGSALMGQAAALGWHDLPTQVWLAMASWQAKDYPGAANRFDAAMRMHPYATEVHQIFDGTANDERFVGAMLDRMVLRPEWLGPYFRDSTATSPEAAHARAVYLTRLLATKTRPAPEDIATGVMKLIHTDQLDAARRLWLAANRLPDIPVLDPRFEHSTTGDTAANDQAVAYQWVLRSVPGATVALAPRAGVAGQALQISTDGTAVGNVATQWLQLKPGSYQLSASSAGTAAALQAFDWAVLCMPSGKAAGTLSNNGARNQAQITIPDVACARQLIVLRSHPSASAAGSPAWFWNPSIR